MRLLLTHGYFLGEDVKEQKIMKPYVPLGLLYLSSHLRAKGFDVDIYDSTFGSRDDLFSVLDRSEPATLGIYGNLMTRPNVLAIATRARAAGWRVVLGGPEPANYAEEYLAAGADVIVAGEGEKSLERLLATGIDTTFDGVISNFGPLNCVEDIRTLRTSLAQIVRPGGFLVLCLMSRFCLMESLHYFCRRQWRKAVRRWMGLTYAEKLGVNVFYPSGPALKRALSPEFCLVRRIGIGLTVPPSYMTGLSPASLEMRDRFDECFAHWPVLRSMADHQLFVFVRK